jgi:ABC-type multidrug transport system ATPase subunit
VIAEGTSAELKAATGGARLTVTLSAPHPSARAALEPYVEGAIHVSQGDRRFQAPVRNTSGLATTVVRALDAAGATVDDVEVRPPSLDDVFFSLTGHAATEEVEEPDVLQALGAGATL